MLLDIARVHVQNLVIVSSDIFCIMNNKHIHVHYVPTDSACFSLVVMSAVMRGIFSAL